MPTAVQKEISSESRLLSALPIHEYEILLPHLRPVRLESGEAVYEPFSPLSDCYFITDSLVSTMTLTEEGASVAVAMIGCEGLLGAAALLEEKLLPYRAVTICSGGALKVSSETLKSLMHRTTKLRSLILCYVRAIFAQVVQTAACNRFHNTEQRLIRWLLLASDRIDIPALPFTHESLSQMLGTDRVSITRAVQRMRKSGSLDYVRGKITILNRELLESNGCECYGAIRDEYDELLNR